MMSYSLLTLICVFDRYALLSLLFQYNVIKPEQFTFEQDHCQFCVLHKSVLIRLHIFIDTMDFGGAGADGGGVDFMSWCVTNCALEKNHACFGNNSFELDSFLLFDLYN